MILLAKCEPVPRYRGCPPICERANLPSFETLADCHRFHEQINERGRMENPWPCPFCDGWHYYSTAAGKAR